MKLLILAGGMSSRMKKNLEGNTNLDSKLIEQANTLPKSMIGLGKDGRPFLDYVLYNASVAGVKEVVLLLNPKDTVSQPYYEKLMADEKSWGLKIGFARQFIPEGREKPLGTTDAIEQTLNQFPAWKESRFIVCNGDNLYPVKAFELLLDEAYPNAMLDWDTEGYTVDRVRNCAIIKKDSEGYLIDLLEKPNDEEWEEIVATMPRIGISWNIFAFTSTALIPFLEKTPLHPVRNEKEIPVTVRMWANENPRGIYTIQIADVLPDLTSKHDIAEVQALLNYDI
ncbi:nucleotidyl transferase [Emticicia oligotrophica DSM 17448]|uniref:Nucleotidyl transferase n=1 Tax=Emticicia oligotrophica (strain DSM 17448 / CIP 109782 / MTCC 6937 / GPTSA100-15) TaxID=929562 RepID=A0ABN4ASH3_EMTOG|nr:sugar phosphate nucleotidyltransferase [Emticicia oligotrophica]AFK04497.1 nucleotidyl transferase [Emticicia oligotrophica DSM 17448]